jgi:hypothetical protein
MRDFVYGKDVVLEAFKIDGYYRWACATDVQITVNSELDFTTTPNSAGWRTKKPSGLNDWFIEFKSLTVLQDAVNTFWYGWETMLESIRNSGLNIRLTFTDIAGNSKYWTGFVYIPQTIMGGATGDFSIDQIKFEGSGAFDPTGALLINSNNVIRVDWITTGAEPNVLQDNALIGKTLKHVSFEGDDRFRIITVGVPNGNEVKFTSATGSILFPFVFDPNQVAYCLAE